MARAALYWPPPGAGMTRPAWSTMRSMRASPPTTMRGRVDAPAHGSADGADLGMSIYQPSARRYSAMARAALPRCDRACFSAALNWPTVRPPGGSESGSKMGS